MEYMLFAPIGGAIALVFAFYLSNKILRADPGNDKMIEIANHIHEGAMAFLLYFISLLPIFYCGSNRGYSSRYFHLT